MPLADDIRALRDRIIVDLRVAHDYYADTKTAWYFVRGVIDAGATFAHQNVVTGTVATQADLRAKVRDYIAEQLAEATFQQFISIFESFFFDFLRLWLQAYPRSLIGKRVDFKAILDSPDKNAIIQHVVERELNEVLYERPAGWFAYLEDKVKLGCPAADEIDRLAEAKATRDVLVHNRGMAGATYASKAAKLARHKAGERIKIPDSYHRETWELIRKLVTDIADAAIAKCP
jgi:hypothetical protein